MADSDVERLQSVLLLAFVEANGAAPMFALQPIAEALARWGVTADPAKANPEAVAEALSSVPSWMREASREHAEPPPTEPDHHAPQETSLVTRAPKRPGRIAKSKMGVVQ